ncbi:MAG: polymer-forming cytoskeletal protein [Gemmatimonadaceae bacterium]|nr:polymer-forming cytoskeletal protein [Gemmatimonadaceae bacterium]
MALWKEQPASPKPAPLPSLSLDAAPVPTREGLNGTDLTTTRETPRFNTGVREMTESVIGSDLTIEGKIEGRGHVRIAGRFKGDVVVDGNLTIDQGAKLIGGMKATAITVAGEVQGNVLDAARVELLASAALVGDVRAATLTVAPGSRMRGHVECGWGDAAATNGTAPAPAVKGAARDKTPVEALDAAS